MDGQLFKVTLHIAIKSIISHGQHLSYSHTPKHRPVVSAAVRNKPSSVSKKTDPPQLGAHDESLHPAEQLENVAGSHGRT